MKITTLTKFNALQLPRLIFLLFAILSVTTNFAQSRNAQIDLELLQLVRKQQLSEDQVKNYIITAQHTSSTSGIEHIYFNQTLNGLRIIGTESSIHIYNGKKLKFNENLISGRALSAQGGSSPSISAENAIRAIARNMGYKTSNLQEKERIGGVNQETIFNTGGISKKDIPAKLAYQLNEKNEVELAWEISIEDINSFEDWWVFAVNAANGSIINKYNLFNNCNILDEHNDLFHSGVPSKFNSETNEKIDFSAYLKVSSPTEESAMVASYNVYAMPDESPHHGTMGRQIVTGIEGAGSPFGWHDTDGVAGAEYTDTRGNNVDSFYQFSTRSDGGASLTFNTPHDLSQSPATSDNIFSATTNLFYWNNIVHDILWEYGFDEASGNFQENNYGNGGLASDSVNAICQAPGNCNATMATPSDGSNPTMSMFICNIATPSRDTAFDNGVIVHEYAHGISNRLTGGGATTNCLNNAEQMGEGWSDFYGLIMTIESGDAGTDARSVGTWLLGTGPDGPGVRLERYSTDMSIYTQTYADLPAAGNSVHRVGEIWAEMLWEMTWGLIADYGVDTNIYNFTGDVSQDKGNVMALALVTEGLKLQPCSPGFVDGRDAILAADVALYGGANACTIWEAFAKRGLGFSANQGSSNSIIDGSPAFDLPPTTATLSTLNTVCIGQGIQIGLTGGSPLGGTYSGAGVTDNGDDTYDFDPTINGPGDTIVTYTVLSPCTGLVETVDDTILVTTGSPGSPPLVCRDLNVILDGTGNATLLVSDLIDNPIPIHCGNPVNITLSQSTFTCSDIGNVTITVTADDGIGGVSTCNSTVTIVDANPIAATQNPTLFLDAMGNAVLTPTDLDNGSANICGSRPFLGIETMSFQSTISAASPVDELQPGFFVQYAPSIFTVDTTGFYTFNMTGSLGSEVFLIIWDDIPIPNSGNFLDRPEFFQFVLWRSDGTSGYPNYFSLDAGKTYYITTFSLYFGNQTLDTIIDREIITTAASTTYSCADIGSFPVDLYAFDAAGNIDTAVATVTIEDSNPTALAKNATVSLDAMGKATLTPADVDNGSANVCGGTPFLALETVRFDGEIDINSPTDDLVPGPSGGTFRYEGSAFRVPVTGDYKFDMTSSTDSGVIILLIWDDTPVPNSGNLFARPEYYHLGGWFNNGILRNGSDLVSLEADKTYYMSIVDNGGGFGTFTLNVDVPIITTAGKAYRCKDIGTSSPVTLYAFDGAGNLDSATATVTVDGILTTYSGGTWDMGVPNLGARAVIDAPLVTGGTSIEACACDVNAALTIEDGDYLQVRQDITVNGSGSLTVNHQASVVQIEDSGMVINHGTINVLVDTPELDGRDFMLMGSPMSLETREGVFSGAQRVRKHLTENFTPNAAVTAASNGAGVWVDEEGDDWLVHSGAINPGEGYMVMRDINGPPIPLNLNFNLGTLNNGVTTYIAGYNGSQSASPSIIANPYASAISATDFINANPGVVDAVYFWEHVTSPSTGIPGPYGLDYTMEDISIFNLTGGTSASGSDPSTTPNGIISTGQGFGVKVIFGPARIIFNNAMRRTTGNTTLRNQDLDRLWLNVQSEGYELNSTALIGFLDQATDDIDIGFDAKRLATNVSLYSHLDDGSDMLGIQARGVFEENVKISMGFATLVDEKINYTISIQNIEGLNLGTAAAYLIDTFEDVTTNLSESDYTFMSVKGIYDNRFILQFTPEGVLGTNGSFLETVTLYPNPTQNTVTIVSPQAIVTSATVYDIRGRKVSEVDFSNQTTYQIDLSTVESALYFIEITTESGTVMKRVMKK